jgi:hypothetical protein
VLGEEVMAMLLKDVYEANIPLKNAMYIAQHLRYMSVQQMRRNIKCLEIKRDMFCQYISQNPFMLNTNLEFFDSDSIAMPEDAIAVEFNLSFDVNVSINIKGGPQTHKSQIPKTQIPKSQIPKSQIPESQTADAKALLRFLFECEGTDTDNGEIIPAKNKTEMRNADFAGTLLSMSSDLRVNGKIFCDIM